MDLLLGSPILDTIQVVLWPLRVIVRRESAIMTGLTFYLPIVLRKIFLRLALLMGFPLDTADRMMLL